MKKITQITGLTIPLAMDDVDTDLIIPAQYLTSTSKQGYGEHLFARLRQNDPNFVFNQPKYTEAVILISRNNFGCGSSREHAVWALQEAGIQAVIAASFADIFASNSAKNGLLLITLAPDRIQSMLKFAEKFPYCLSIDLEKQTITSTQEEIVHFVINPFLKDCFLQGMDELDYLLSYQRKIEQHKQK